MATKITLMLEAVREDDGTLSLSLEEPALEAEARYVDGVSEGQVIDVFELASAAGQVVKGYLIENAHRLPGEPVRASVG